MKRLNRMGKIGIGSIGAALIGFGVLFGSILRAEGHGYWNGHRGNGTQYYRVEESTFTIPEADQTLANDEKTFSVSCDAGDVAISVNGYWDAGGSYPGGEYLGSLRHYNAVPITKPDGLARGYQFFVTNFNTQYSGPFTGEVVCAH